MIQTRLATFGAKLKFQFFIFSVLSGALIGLALVAEAGPGGSRKSEPSDSKNHPSSVDAAFLEALKEEQKGSSWRVSFEPNSSYGMEQTNKFGHFSVIGREGKKIFEASSLPFHIPFHGFGSTELKRDPFVLAHILEELLSEKLISFTEVSEAIAQMQTLESVADLDDLAIGGRKISLKLRPKTFRVSYELDFHSGIHDSYPRQVRGGHWSRAPIQSGGFGPKKTQIVITGPGVGNTSYTSFAMALPEHGHRFDGHLLAVQIEWALKSGQLNLKKIQGLLDSYELFEKLENGVFVGGVELNKIALPQLSEGGSWKVIFALNSSYGLTQRQKIGFFYIVGPEIVKGAGPHAFRSYSVEIPIDGHFRMNPSVLAFEIAEGLNLGIFDLKKVEKFLDDYHLGEKLQKGLLARHYLELGKSGSACIFDLKSLF